MDETGFWTRRRLAGFFVFLALFIVVAGFAWQGLSRLLQKDRVFAQAASPDGRFVARLWCRGNCPPHSPKILAISPAGRDVGLRAVDQGSSDVFVIPPPQEGDMPDEDVVTDLRWVDARGGGTLLRWTGARSLVIEQPCLTDGAWRDLTPVTRQGISIQFVRQPLPAAARAFNYTVGESSQVHYLNEETARCVERERRG